MAVLLSGKPVAEHMCRDIRLRCEKLSRRGVTPTLGIVRVGRREEDIAYERGAIRRAESLNIAVRRFLLPADASQQELIQTLRTVNEDSSIHGCLLFRPLPPHLDTEAVTSVLAPEKDTRSFCQDADIIISAAGCLDLIRADYVRPGQVVVDVGVNIGPDGAMHGDVAFDEVEPIVAAITPVPGGVGAVTSTVLALHVAQAACRSLEQRRS